MKCALVWRNGYAELRVTQCNADEYEYLKKQIGKSVEVEIRPTTGAVDLGDSSALEVGSTPEDLSAGQGESRPAPNH